MLSFTKFVTEQSITGAFNIPRASMPQIANQEGFAKYLEFIGVEVGFSKTPLAFISPTQTEFDPAKVSAINAPYGPIIISSDCFILDGHHRFFAAVADADCDMIDAYTCGATINQLLAHAYEYLSDE